MYDIKLNYKNTEKGNPQVKFYENDTAIINFTVYDGDILITDYDQVDILIQDSNDVTIGYAMTSLNPLYFKFGTSIPSDGVYKIRLQVRKGTERRTTYEHRIEFTPEWISTQGENEENITVHTDMYNKINTNANNTAQHETRLQTIESDLPNKLDKTTTTQQSIASKVEFLNDLILRANLYMDNGTAKEIVTEILKTYKDVILLRENAQTPLADGELARIEAVNYDGTGVNGSLGFDNKGRARVGDKGDEQLLATIEEFEQLIDEGIVKWDATNLRLYTVTSDAVTSDITLTEPITQNTKVGLAQIKSIQGLTKAIPTQAELDIASYSINDTLQNSIEYIDNQPRVNENVGQVTLKNSNGFTLAGNSTTDYQAFFIKLPNNLVSIKSNYLPTLNHSLWGSNATEEGIYNASDGYSYISLLKTKASNLNELETYLTNNPLTVTYELAIKNPKQKTIVDGDVVGVTNLTNVTYAQIAVLSDNKAFTNNVDDFIKFDNYGQTTYSERDNSSNINKFYTVGSKPNNVYFIVALGTTQAEIQTLLRGKTLTYQLAQPRIAMSTLESVYNPTFKVVGKNLFDGEVELGGIAGATGLNYSTNDRIRSINYISISPSTNYKTNLTNNGASYIFFYDKNKNYISYINAVNVLNFTTPNNCHYIRLVDYTTDLSKGIMLSYEALPYEPYTKVQTTLNETLHGLSSVKDDVEVVNGELVTNDRMLRVNLWEMNYTKSSSPNQTNTIAYFTDLLDNFTSNIIINSFVYNQNTYNDDLRCYSFDSNNNRLLIRVEKSIINDIMTTQSLNEVNALKYYLDPITGIKGQFVGERKTPIKRLAKVTGNLELYEGGTIYYSSDGIINDAVITVAINDKAIINMQSDYIKRLNNDISDIRAILANNNIS